jgi:hypothetical protein
MYHTAPPGLVGAASAEPVNNKLARFAVVPGGPGLKRRTCRLAAVALHDCGVLAPTHAEEHPSCHLALQQP